MAIHSVRVKLVHPDATLPRKMSDGSAGYDLHAAEPVTVPAARSTPDGGAEIGRALVPIGIVLELPDNTVGRIASRSGLSTRSNIETGAGWIDSDYRGELFVLMTWLGEGDSYTVRAGERIAQILISPIPNVSFRVVDFDDLGQTERGEGGFGSTGRF